MPSKKLINHSKSFKKDKTLGLYIEIWKIWGHKNKYNLIVANILMVIVAASTAAYPILIDFSFDVLTLKEKEKLKLIPALIIGVTLLKGISYYFQTILVSKIANNIIKDIQGALFEKIIRLDLLTVTKERPGALQSRLINDVNILKESIIRLFNNLVRDFLTLIGLICSMIYLDWVLTLAVLLIYPLCFLPVIELGKKTRKLANSFQETIGTVASFLNENFSGIRLIKAFNLETKQTIKANNNFKNIFDVSYNMVKTRAKLEPILEIVGGIAISAVIVIAGIRIISGSSDVGSFSGFISALLIAVQPARALGTLNAVVQEGAAAANRVLSLYFSKIKIKERTIPIILNIVKGQIELKNINFSYTKGKKTLHNISLKINEKEKIAIIGPSGSGKSTLVNLIPRLFDPSSGSIKIDNQELKKLGIASLRSKIAVVAQDVMLFNTSILDNIRYGKHSATVSEVKEAAKEADANKFILSLPKGYNTNVGERGLNLSGGERQKIAIARAILRKPNILILDEPTSSLDSQSEKNISKSLDKLSKNCTTITIAHKINTVIKSDRIIVMNKGKIIAEGNHKELMDNSDEYRKIISMHNI